MLLLPRPAHIIEPTDSQLGILDTPDRPGIREAGYTVRDLPSDLNVFDKTLSVEVQDQIEAADIMLASRPTWNI